MCYDVCVYSSTYLVAYGPTYPRSKTAAFLGGVRVQWYSTADATTGLRRAQLRDVQSGAVLHEGYLKVDGVIRHAEDTYCNVRWVHDDAVPTAFRVRQLRPCLRGTLCTCLQTVQPGGVRLAHLSITSSQLREDQTSRGNMSDKLSNSVVNDLFDEELAEEAEYNPALSAAELKKSPYPYVLLQCEATVRLHESLNRVIAYQVLTRDPESIILDSGPILTSRIVGQVALTEEEALIYQRFTEPAPLLRDSKTRDQSGEHPES